MRKTKISTERRQRDGDGDERWGSGEGHREATHIERNAERDLKTDRRAFPSHTYGDHACRETHTETQGKTDTET